MQVAESAQDVQMTVNGQPMHVVVYPRRALHSQDGASIWADEDGVWLFQDGLLLLDGDDTYVPPDDTAAWQTWYVLHWAPDMQAVMIDSPSGPLLPGLDFFQTADRLLLRQHPRQVCPSGKMVILTKTPSSASESYCLRSELPTDQMQASAATLRKNPTVARLQSWLDAETGVIRAPVSGSIDQVSSLEHGCRYVCAGADWFVPYDHKELQAGAVVTEGRAFGASMDLTEQGTNGPDWWRALDWSAGLSLDGLTPFQGLAVPPGMLLATAIDVAGVVRVRLTINGDPSVITRWQQWSLYAEQVRYSSSSPLATLLGFDTAGQTKMVDGLALLFNGLWGRKAVVLSVRGAYNSVLIQELRARMPMTSLLIVQRLPVN
jgi:hypothetical protein